MATALETQYSRMQTYLETGLVRPLADASGSDRDVDDDQEHDDDL